MINPPKELGIFGWKRLLLTIAVLLFLNGIVKWFSTPQEEDPQLPPRDGIVTVIYPGAPPADVDVSLIAPASASLTFVTNAVAAKIFLHERVDRRRWMAALLVAGGVVLLAA